VVVPVVVVPVVVDVVVPVVGSPGVVVVTTCSLLVPLGSCVCLCRGFPLAASVRPVESPIAAIDCEYECLSHG
jgi:hypothetical protein